MFRKFCAAAAVIGFGISAAAVSPAFAGAAAIEVDTVSSLPVTVTESGFVDFQEGFFELNYTISNDSPAEPGDTFGGIAGFAIDFGVPPEFDLEGVNCFSPTNWDCTIATASEWDSGVPIFLEGQDTSNLALGEIDTFAEFFGELAEVAVIFFNDSPEFNLFGGDSLGGFGVNGEGIVLNSTAAVICEDDLNICGSSAQQEVSEPGTLALLGIGLVGIGAAAHRRRRRSR